MFTWFIPFKVHFWIYTFGSITHMLHGAGIFTNICPKTFQKYTVDRGSMGNGSLTNRPGRAAHEVLRLLSRMQPAPVPEA